ncbi:hypothetical protein Ngar_c01170 [Candidatus Nitrososphaera gargensis Ga9.2]|uniref:Uncharacterized protein n=1 Tax=Nitrososphaera gargensis (strain Ga9.2) TaxID=1237085 RepID=K0IGX5_NITGG|nr:hypothetical protein [Candidatus Nitrososphaera gargensis]AFU57067.1 hypothetical protein Ngar_c01170 [Candidatus Nitrososphaera gargensis Ga9.2]
MLTNLDELERAAAKYAELKRGENNAELAQIAGTIVDSISLPSFSFPLKEETLSSNGTTTYVYENNATFPALYDFLGELLHSKVPLEIREAKFGPGEIIVARQSKEEADAALDMSIKELQELVHARESEILSKYAADTP